MPKISRKITPKKHEKFMLLTRHLISMLCEPPRIRLTEHIFSLDVFSFVFNAIFWRKKRPEIRVFFYAAFYYNFTRKLRLFGNVNF